MNDIEARVKAIVVEQLGVDEGEVTNTSSFTDDLGADSLDMLDLVIALEDEFGSRISDEVMKVFSTAKDVVDYIRAHYTPDSWGDVQHF